MRYWKIDVARGIAVTLMIVYHFLFDIYYFKDYTQPFYLFAGMIACIFIAISGACLSISYSRGGRFLKFSKRGVKLLSLGILITVISFLLLRRGVIIFGILHFFGISSFLIYPFLKYLRNNLSYLLFGILMIVAGVFLLNFRVDFYHLIWLGFMPNGFNSFDYFPILPWFGIMLIGVFLGRKLYPKGKRNFKVSSAKGRVVDLFRFLGRNSLTIYFIHQPIIISVLFLLGHSELLSVLNF